MRRLASLFFVLAAIPACTTSDAPLDQDPGSQDGSDQVENPDPEVDLCSATDGVCLAQDQCATSDPDCGESEPAPEGCTPNPLPPNASKLTSGISGLFSPTSVALAADRFYMTAFTNASPSTTKVYSCPLTGCPASPSSFGAGLDSHESFVAAIGGYVYWSQKDGDFAEHPNQILRANADGSGQSTVISAPDGLGYYSQVSRNIGVFDDYALVFDVVSRDGSTSLSNAGVRVATDSLMSPALPGISAPAYSMTSVTGNDSYIAYHANPVSGLTAPYDRKVHIYDLDGNQVGVTSGTYTYMRKMEIVDDHLLFMTDSGWFACSLPGCSDAKNIGSAVNVRGFTFGVHGGRVYFGSVADQGCNKGLTGVLASCTSDSLIDGTCTPTQHSTSIHWVNLNTIGINDSNVVMTSRTDTLAVYGVSL